MKKLGGQGSGCTNRKLMPNNDYDYAHPVPGTLLSGRELDCSLDIYWGTRDGFPIHQTDTRTANSSTLFHLSSLQAWRYSDSAQTPCKSVSIRGLMWVRGQELGTASHGDKWHTYSTAQVSIYNISTYLHNIYNVSTYLL